MSRSTLLRDVSAVETEVAHVVQKRRDVKSGCGAVPFRHKIVSVVIFLLSGELHDVKHHVCALWAGRRRHTREVDMLDEDWLCDWLSDAGVAVRCMRAMTEAYDGFRVDADKFLIGSVLADYVYAQNPVSYTHLTLPTKRIV